MDIVIPLTTSKINYLDLRYVLRSVEKFTQAAEVIIIGEKPEWLTNVTHIRAEDAPGKEWKERNIYRKTCLAFKDLEEFLFMNDDHIFLSDTDIVSYPYYYKGTCYESMLNNNTHYRATMNHTRKWLEARGVEAKNFDGHCPIVFKRLRFTNIMNQVNWEVPFGYGMKSLYCEGMEGEFLQDKKLHKQLTQAQAAEACRGRHIVSCADGAMKTGLKDYLQTILPHKSKYER